MLRLFERVEFQARGAHVLHTLELELPSNRITYDCKPIHEDDPRVYMEQERVILRSSTPPLRPSVTDWKSFWNDEIDDEIEI